MTVTGVAPEQLSLTGRSGAAESVGYLALARAAQLAPPVERFAIVAVVDTGLRTIDVPLATVPTATVPLPLALVMLLWPAPSVPKVIGEPKVMRKTLVPEVQGLLTDWVPMNDRPLSVRSLGCPPPIEWSVCARDEPVRPPARARKARIERRLIRMLLCAHGQ